MPNTLKILSVVGARPNFMKIAPLVRAINSYNHQDNRVRLEHLLVHTGQHYDERMSKSFFDDLDIPRPDIDLGIGSGSHAQQVGNTMIEFEKVVREHQPDWIVVVGDVNATCACSITAKKEQVNLAHIEAGLRSFDLKMPEEINRMVTDRLADLLFATDDIAMVNLRKEGRDENSLALVGNIMIDTLEAYREDSAKLTLEEIITANKASESDNNISTSKDGCRSAPSTDEIREIEQEDNRFIPKENEYAVLTMHRPSNVDSESVLRPIIHFLLHEICSDIPVIWPIHPRTKKQLREFNLWDSVKAEKNMLLLEPVGYKEMLRLNLGASLMLTDSGGLQEECCILGTPCMTLRWNTERPMTLQEHGGASVLVGNSVEKLRKAYRQLRRSPRSPKRPRFWDGHTAERIVGHLTRCS